MRTTPLIFLAALTLLAGCGGGDGPSTPTNPTTAAEYVARGWDRFEDDNLSGAAEDFQSALDLNAAYGPALAGQGWTRLVTADSDTDMTSAETVFDAAVDQGEDGAYVLGGRAAARLGRGQWSDAITDAAAALAADSDFAFSHRPSFTYRDLYLITAFAEAATGDLDGALAAADVVEDSGIDPGLPATWMVGGLGYYTYAGAVLAHLAALSESHAG